MAKKKISSKDVRSNINQINAVHQAEIELIDKQLAGLNRIYQAKERQLLIDEKIRHENSMLKNGVEYIKSLSENNIRINKLELKNIIAERKEHEKSVKELEKKLKTQNALLNTVKNAGKFFTTMGGSMRGFFMASDAAMKNITLELGLSSERAAIMRDNFQDSAQFAARMGVDMEGLTQMTRIYAEETGRARLHNEANLKSMTLIAKGTALGIQGAAEMSANYEMMGFNATDTANEVQRIVDTTERMGVNTGKVLKAVNKNFKTLQKYTFRGGSKGMADMAIYATKMKVNLDEVFSALEKGRALDSVIEMSAQLQVLGGQFANLADPMSMLFESRNDPEAYTKRINEMTRGMVTMNKTAKGFELQIASPMAQDQLAAAAKALGMTTDELTTQAFRMREIQQTRSQMFSKGFTKDEKEIIEGLAKFDKTSGKMMVEIGGVATDVSKLGTQQVAALKQQQVTLEKRAEDSQTFDQVLQNTINELKSTLLPILKGVNAALEYARPVIKSFTDGIGELMKSDFAKSFLSGAGMLMAGATAFSLIIAPLGKVAGSLVRGVGSLAGGGLLSGGANATGGASKGAVGGASKGAGLSALGKGAGVGVAAVGIGTGVMLAAKGISQLADSMSKLDKTQIWALPATVGALALAIAAFTVPLAILGPVLTTSSLGLLAFGVTAVGIGAGIGIAATGIGFMAEGLAKLENVDLINIGVGIAAIGAGAIASTLGIVGLAGMTASIIAIGASADGLERVGNAFSNIGAVLKGNASQFKEVRDTIKAIASTEVGSNSAIASLTEMLSKPLRVEFSEKEVGFIANIDVSMGDSNFITQISKKIPARIVDLQQAKS